MKSLRVTVFSWAIALFVTLTVLLAPPAYSSPLLQVNGSVQLSPQLTPKDSSPQEPSANSTSPQGKAATTDDVQEEQRGDRPSNHSTTKTAPQSETPSAGPYDMDSIQEFNRALYGS
jgi:hypothetical protein